MSTDETCRICRARTAWGEEWLCDDCRAGAGDPPATDDIELSRDVDRIVTAISIRIDCLRCYDWFSGNRRTAHLGYQAHMAYVHPEERS